MLSPTCRNRFYEACVQIEARRVGRARWNARAATRGTVKKQVGRRELYVSVAAQEMAGIGYVVGSRIRRCVPGTTSMRWVLQIRHRERVSALRSAVDVGRTNR